MNRLETGALGYQTLAGKSSPLPVGWQLRFDRASSGPGIPQGNRRQFRLRITRGVTAVGAAGSGPDFEQRPAIFGASSTDCGRERARIFGLPPMAARALRRHAGESLLSAAGPAPAGGSPGGQESDIRVTE